MSDDKDECGISHMLSKPEAPKCNCEPYLRESCEVCRPKRDGKDYPPEAPVSAREWTLEKRNSIGHLCVRGPDTVGENDQLQRIKVIDIREYEKLERELAQSRADNARLDQSVAALYEQLTQEQLKSAALIECLIRAKGNIVGNIEGHYFQMGKEYLAKDAVEKATKFIDDCITKWGSK